jgi:hypothetical protein
LIKTLLIVSTGEPESEAEAEAEPGASDSNFSSSSVDRKGELKPSVVSINQYGF